jgi:hypothetical protein
MDLSGTAARRHKRLLLAGAVQADEAHVEVLAVAIAASVTMNVVIQAMHGLEI